MLFYYTNTNHVYTRTILIAYTDLISNNTSYYVNSVCPAIAATMIRIGGVNLFVK